MTKTIWTMTISTILLAGLVAPAFTSNAFATELVVNGSFEEPNIAPNTWTVFPSIPGWGLSFGHSIEVRDNVVGTASDGDQFVELDSYSNSGMSQTITTVPGYIYSFSFDYSPRINQPASTNTIEAYWDGNLIATLTGEGSNINVWSTETFNVAATASSTVIEFRAAGTSDRLGGNIDNVSVTLSTAVIEIDIKPGSYPSSVSCKNDKGVVPVAVFGSDEFDASTIDVYTLELNRELVTESHGTVHVEDINDDGFDDAVLHLEKAEVCDATEGYPLKEESTATLSGESSTGSFEGTGDIRIVN
ncbi:MAG: DUF642 domain-containing protein [Nitrosopumilus sp.]|nr:DUF642 domain-containing protein [Nitrosopumilus sp.]